MKKGLIGIILASSLALPSCDNSFDKNYSELTHSTREIVRQELKNPLFGKEAYEIGGAGTYQCHLETMDEKGEPGSCLSPFHKFNASCGTLYLVRLDSEKPFEKPCVAKKDKYDQSGFDLGRYEVWIENKGYFAPIDRFDANNEDERVRVLKVYQVKELEEAPNVAPLPQVK